MKRFLASNITWLYRYFDTNKSLFEIFSFLIVAQSFVYSSDLKGIGNQSISAFRIVLWIMIFLIILLLQVSTSVEMRRGDKEASGTILQGANFMKVIMRLLTLVLLLASVPIFVRQLETSIHNSLFSVFYGSLGLIVVFELFALLIALMMKTIRK